MANVTVDNKEKLTRHRLFYIDFSNNVELEEEKIPKGIMGTIKRLIFEGRLSYTLITALFVFYSSIAWSFEAITGISCTT